jgi:hypothetical protein
LTKWPQNSKWRRKPTIFKFYSQNLNFLTISKNLNAFEASICYLTYIEKTFFAKIQNGGFFEGGFIFEKKSTFFKWVVPTLNSTFFKSKTGNSVVQRPKINQKKLPKKIFKDAGYFQNGVCFF